MKGATLLNLPVHLRPKRDERGQATAEYALVLLGVAAVALLVLAWATNTGQVGDLLDAVLDKVRSSVNG